MKILFPIFLVLITSLGFGQNVKLVGKVGNYPIEMEIHSTDSERGLFEGVYNYKGKKNHLTIKGEMMTGVMYMEEFYDGNETGSFYLHHTSDTLTGKWINHPKWFDVELIVKSGDLNSLYAKSLDEYAEDVSTDITGGYATETFFINELFFQEDRPEIEVGFNGGHAIIKELSADSIEYDVQVICGPTYHFAFAGGVAVKDGDVYVHTLTDECTVYIKFSEKKVYIEADGGYDCGFGARAYLAHTFTKITDRSDFYNEEVSIEDLKGISEK